MSWKRAECDLCGKIRSCQTFEASHGSYEDPPEHIEVCFLCQKDAERADAKERAYFDELDLGL